MRFLSALFLSLTISLIGTNYARSEDETKSGAEELKSKVETLEENVLGLTSDVNSLKKIKISGYLQTQFEKTEDMTGLAKQAYDSTSPAVQSRFRIRRSRLKFAYDGGLTQFVVQGDFSNEKFELKDAYLSLTDPWTKYLSLTAGVFNRPNYEVEYSSSQRESPERSKVIKTLYPGERDLGAMFTVEPEGWFKLQLATFNNTQLGDLSQYAPNYRNEPFYYMARLTKEFAFNDLGLGLDIGAHARIGNAVANNTKVYTSEMKLGTDSVPVAPNVSLYTKGSALKRNWYGVEAQLYWDFLGGTKLMGEYIFGSNVDEMSTTASKAIRLRDFNGFYCMLVKNIDKDFQVAVKYDKYNPNTKIDKSLIDSKNDLSVSTLGFGLHNYSFNNIRITLWYDMVSTETSNNIIVTKAKTYQLQPVDPKDNLLTLRFQYKF